MGLESVFTVVARFRGQRRRVGGARPVLCAFALFAFCLSAGGPAYSQIDQHKLENPDVGVSLPLGIGASMAIDGDTLMVGASLSDSSAGRVQVYRRSVGGSWELESELSASDPTAGDRFGGSVAVLGDTAVVGASAYHPVTPTRAGSAYVFVRSGGAWTQQAKLIASDGAVGDQFGCSVSVLGDTVVVGAQGDDAYHGSAYVFTRSGEAWAEQAKLTASDGAASEGFGCSVVLRPDAVMVGAAGDDTGRGAAYVFTRSGSVWSEQQKLTASDPAEYEGFGMSVAMSGDTAVVGAFAGDGVGGNPTGAAYVFVLSGGVWTEQQKITADDGDSTDNFGHSVAVSSDTAVVGAPSDDGAGADSGSAYVFTRSGGVWSQQQKLTASDAGEYELFGLSLVVSGDTAVCGSPTKGGGTSPHGAVYVFTRSGSAWTQEQTMDSGFPIAAYDVFGCAVAVSGDTAVVGSSSDGNVEGTLTGSVCAFARSGGVWSFEQKMVASDAASNDSFGCSVAASGDTMIAGARGDDDAGSNSGSAYVFTRSGGVWSQQAKLTALDAAAGDRFGYAVAVDGDTAIVGAYLEEHGGNSPGAAYVFVRSGEAWTQQAKLIPPDNPSGIVFGNAVAISADTVIVGAREYPEVGMGSPGVAYVFTRSGVTWTQQAKLTASDALGFSNAVSLSGDTAVVAADGDDDGGTLSGSACVFTRSGATWTRQTKLTASDAAAGDYFGASVAVRGDMVVVGSPCDDDGGSDCGSAYVFSRSGEAWTQEAKLSASDAAAGDWLGAFVALDSGTALCGAPTNDDPETDSGAAYVFDVASLEAYSLTVEVNIPHGTVIVSPDLPSYEYGSTVTLTADPDPEYRFVSWSGDVPAGHEADNPLILTIGETPPPNPLPARAKASGTASEPAESVVVKGAKSGADGPGAASPAPGAFEGDISVMANFVAAPAAGVRAEIWQLLE